MIFHEQSEKKKKKKKNISSKKKMNYCLNYSNLGHKSIQCVKLGMLLHISQHEQHNGQFRILVYFLHKISHQI